MKRNKTCKLIREESRSEARRRKMRAKKSPIRHLGARKGALLKSFWFAKSQSFAARFIRERVAEIGQKIELPGHKPTPGEWNHNTLTASWLGHSTVLINFFGVTILTDPVLMPALFPKGMRKVKPYLRYTPQPNK